MSRQQTLNSLKQTERYDNVIEYMISLGYSRRQAETKVKNYVLSNNYVNLDVFVKEKIPISKKTKGYFNGSKKPKTIRSNNNYFV